MCGGPPLDIPGILWQKVYPRVCGGTAEGGSNSAQRRGLSPRVRGNPVPGESGLVLRRSIPACAGEPGIIGWLA